MCVRRDLSLQTRSLVLKYACTGISHGWHAGGIITPTRHALSSAGRGAKTARPSYGFHDSKPYKAKKQALQQLRSQHLSHTPFISRSEPRLVTTERQRAKDLNLGFGATIEATTSTCNNETAACKRFEFRPWSNHQSNN